jgi:hypothetical protein
LGARQALDRFAGRAMIRLALMRNQDKNSIIEFGAIDERMVLEAIHNGGWHKNLSRRKK